MLLLGILSGLGLVLAALALFIRSRPPEFRIVRSARIKAAPETVFAFVNDFRQWPLWSPWEKLDPALKRRYAGSASGPGATYEWFGNNKAGEGRMTILSSHPGDFIRIRLEFIKPFEATHAVEFKFRREGDLTAVTWTMTGTRAFMARAFNLVMNMDRMIGADFEKGLMELRTLAEAGQP